MKIIDFTLLPFHDRVMDCNQSRHGRVVGAQIVPGKHIVSGIVLSFQVLVADPERLGQRVKTILNFTDFTLHLVVQTHF